MDSEEIAALAAGLGKAMADGLAANEAVKEEKAEAAKRARAESAEAKRIAEKRSKALHGVIETFERERRNNAATAERAVQRYCSNVRSDVLEPLKKDPRMPRTINYLERYGALVGMQDRGVVLKRLGATIDLADEILDAADKVDVQGAMAEAAGSYVQGVMRLDGICVSEPDRVPESAVEDEPATSPEEQNDYADISLAIEEAFGSIFGDLPDIEAEKSEEIEAAKAREKAIDSQIDEAAKAAIKAAEGICRSKAMAVCGSVYSLDDPAMFDEEIALKATKDFDLVRQLSAEVHASFKTFSQVVQDNGLFAAFASENAYGACNGFHFDWWWDDMFYDEFEGEIPGRQTYDDIPTSVEEDKGGDSLEKAIERMQAFDKQKYWGLLDDDFQQFVDAFWYGFKKLMVNVNSLFEIDSRAFGKYCGQVSKVAQNKAAALGAQMDGYQVSQFCEEISNRAKSK